jgi:cytochrome c biogenesis protein ResB
MQLLTLIPTLLTAVARLRAEDGRVSVFGIFVAAIAIVVILIAAIIALLVPND